MPRTELFHILLWPFLFFYPLFCPTERSTHFYQGEGKERNQPIERGLAQRRIVVTEMTNLCFFFLAAAKGILSLPTVTEQNDRARHHSVPAMLHNSKRKTSRLAVRRRSTRWNLIATNVQVRVFLKFRSFWSPRLEERIAYINTQTPIYPFKYSRLEKTLTPSSKSKSWIHFWGELCAGKARLPRASLDKRRTRDGENRAYIQVPWEFYTGIGISALWSNPLILFYTIFGRKGSLFFTFYWQKVTLSHKKV